jgi:hypothetical protein
MLFTCRYTDLVCVLWKIWLLMGFCLYR